MVNSLWKWPSGSVVTDALAPFTGCRVGQVDRAVAERDHRDDTFAFDELSVGGHRPDRLALGLALPRIPAALQYPPQVDEQLLVDVFAVRDVDDFRLVADRDLELPVAHPWAAPIDSRSAWTSRHSTLPPPGWAKIFRSVSR